MNPIVKSWMDNSNGKDRYTFIVFIAKAYGKQLQNIISNILRKEQMKPTWMDIAEKEIGQHEIKGGENPRIIEYDTATSLKAKEDETPWCAAFVNWCLVQSGILGTNSAAAKSFLDWGRKIDTPEYGCVCVIHQKQSGADNSTGSSSGYHVAFWTKEENGHAYLLGGNQSDSVKISGFNLASYEICGYFMPLM